jgi:hypothetical protein
MENYYYDNLKEISLSRGNGRNLFDEQARKQHEETESPQDIIILENDWKPLAEQLQPSLLSDNNSLESTDSNTFFGINDSDHHSLMNAIEFSEFCTNFTTDIPSDTIKMPCNSEKGTSKSSKKFKQKICSNCNTTSSPAWRRGQKKELLCNGCGLYFVLL